MPVSNAATQVSPSASKSGDREIASTRIFNAPRDLVWKLFTEPEHIKQWWGPRGFSLTIHKMDVRPGGEWSFIMHGPDGRDYENEVTYTAVVRPTRIAYKHTVGPFFEAITDFTEENGKTIISWRMIFPSAADRDATAEKYGAVEGLTQTIDRLEERVAYTVDAPGFQMSRTFHAPRELVWKAWIDPECLAKWWGPKEFPTTVVRMDVRRGGEMLYYMTAPGGQEFWSKWVYREIVPPAKLIYVSCFSDAQGGLTRHPFFPNWPAYGLHTVTFTEEAGKTTLTIHSVPLGANDIERAALAEGLPMMTAGYSSSFEKLDEFLAG